MKGWRLRGPALWLMALGYMAAILWVGSRSSPLPSVDLGGGTDKVLHAFAYGILSFLLTRAIAHSLPQRGPFLPGALAVTLTVICGILDEVHQSYIPARDGSTGDVIADAAGALFGAVAMTLLLMPRLRQRSSKRREELGTPPAG